MPDLYDFLSDPFLPKALSADSILGFNPEHGFILWVEYWQEDS